MRWVLKYGESKLHNDAMKEARIKEKTLFEEARKKLMNIPESEIAKASRLGQIELVKQNCEISRSKSEVK